MDVARLHAPCGLMLPKKLLINHVDGSKIVHILHEDLCIIRSNVSRAARTNSSKSIKRCTLSCIPSPYRCLDDLPNLAPSSLNNTLQILERLACLGFHTALDEIASLGIEAEASGNEHEGWAHDALPIWPKALTG